MSTLDQFNQIVTDFDKHADFITVYVTEAHPSDGWLLPGDSYDFLKQHTTIEERISAAKMLKESGVPCPVLIDTMDNESLYEYGSFPEALYIIENGIVKFKGLGPYRDCTPENVRKCLESLIKRE